MVCCVLRTVSYTGHTEWDSFKPVTGKFIIRTHFPSVYFFSCLFFSDAFLSMILKISALQSARQSI